jgi:hypothetical protein
MDEPAKDFKYIPALPGFNLVEMTIDDDDYDVHPIIGWEIVREPFPEGAATVLYPVSVDGPSVSGAVMYPDGRVNGMGGATYPSVDEWLAEQKSVAKYRKWLAEQKSVANIGESMNPNEREAAKVKETRKKKEG